MTTKNTLNTIAAIYARVSSDAQAQEQTIASQVADLRRQVDQDGATLHDTNCFLDDGVSGSTLHRPALEQLRDAAYVGSFQKLYVHSPDRGPAMVAGRSEWKDGRGTPSQVMRVLDAGADAVGRMFGRSCYRGAGPGGKKER